MHRLVRGQRLDGGKLFGTSFAGMFRRLDALFVLDRRLVGLGVVVVEVPGLESHETPGTRKRLVLASGHFVHLLVLVKQRTVPEASLALVAGEAFVVDDLDGLEWWSRSVLNLLHLGWSGWELDHGLGLLELLLVFHVALAQERPGAGLAGEPDELGVAQQPVHLVSMGWTEVVGELGTAVGTRVGLGEDLNLVVVVHLVRHGHVTRRRHHLEVRVGTVHGCLLVLVVHLLLLLDVAEV